MENNISIKNKSIKVLILEDSLQDMKLMVAHLSQAGYLLDVTHSEDETRFREALKKNKYDIILSDFKLPGFDAFGALEICQEFCPEVPFICVSGSIGEVAAVELLKKGAVDYVIKDRPDRLPYAVQNAIEKAKEKAAHFKTACELKENYNLIRLAGEKAKLGGWFVVLKENRFYWSDVVASIHEMPSGYAPLVDEGINFYAPEWRDRITKVFTDCATKGIPYDEEMEIITATGRRVWVRTIGEAVRDENGNIVKVQGAFQNITLKKQAEKELKNSEALYKAIFESTGTATLIVEEDTTILTANNECLNLTGYTSSELIGQKWTNYAAQESLQEMLSNHQLRLKNPKLAPRKYDVKLLNSKGEKRDAVLNINMIPGTKQSVVSMLDITERKQAEKELQKSKSSLEEYFENDISADYVVSVEGEIFSCNKTFLEFFGLEKKLQTEKFNITQLYKNPNDRKELLRKVKETGKAENFEVDFITLDGKEMNVILNAIGIFDDSGKLIKLRGYVVDVTKQKLAEKELLESEQKYRLLFANNPQPMWIYDIETLVFLEVNQAAISHYGYSQEEFLSMTLKDIRPVEDIPALLEDIKNTRLEYNSAGEWRHLKKNGEIINVEITSHSVLFNNRNARHILINDITERKRVQFEYQTMIKTSKDGFWVVDALTGKLIDVNQAYCEMIGFTREELLQMTIRDVEAVETQEETRQHIELIIEKGFDSFETKHKTKSGKIIDIEASVTYILLSTEQFFVFVKDISERKRAENEILKLSHSVEQSPASVIVTDLNGNMEYVNQKTLEITGYTKEELIGKNPRVFKSGEKPKEEYQQLWSVILSGKEWYGKFHNKKKNGELYWESASISPILNDKQKIINYVAVKEDITERKRLEDAQKLMLEISQLATKNTTLTSFLAEVHQKIKQIIRADNFYVALYNEMDNTFSFPYHVDEHDLVQLNKPYDFSNGYTDYVLKTNQSLIITPQNQLEVEKDGTINGRGDELSVWLGVPFKTTEGNKPNGVMAIQDYKNLESYTETDKSIMEIIAHNIGSFIERIKYVEELVSAKAKAEEMNRVKSYFFSNMSHELRTPFVGIMGYAELLYSELENEDHREMVEGILKTSNRMLETLDNILNITKFEFDGIELKFQPFNYTSLLKTFAKEFEITASKKGLKLICNYKDENLIVDSDERAIGSIISNLLSNAVKYTTNGEVTLYSELETFNNSNFLVIKIIDSGIGIPENKKELIFDEFRQVSEGTTRRFDGTGLGLAIVKKTVNQLGGTILVESEVGKGSTFTVSLPVKINVSNYKLDDHSNKIKSSIIKNEKLHGKTLLYIEDDPAAQDVFRRALSTIYNFDFVPVAEDAFKLINQKEYDAFLVDINLGMGIDGLEIVNQINQITKYKNTPKIAITAFASEEDRSVFLNNGFTHYFSKPFLMEDLKELLAKLFSD